MRQPEEVALWSLLLRSPEPAKPRTRGPEPETLSLLRSWGTPLVLWTALSGHPWSQWPRRSQPGLISMHVPRERRLSSLQGNNAESRQGSPTECQRRGICFCSQETEKIYLKLALNDKDCLKKLRRISHTIKFTISKYTIQRFFWIFTKVQFSLLSADILITPAKETLYQLAINPLCSFLPPDPGKYELTFCFSGFAYSGKTSVSGFIHLASDFQGSYMS